MADAVHVPCTPNTDALLAVHGVPVSVNVSVNVSVVAVRAAVAAQAAARVTVAAAEVAEAVGRVERAGMGVLEGLTAAWWWCGRR